MTEGLLLGMTGAIAGLILGWLGLQWLLKIIPESSPLRMAPIARIDWRILLFGSALGILTSVLFSTGPAFVSTRVNLSRALHFQSRSVIGGHGLRSGLVVCEIVLCLTLLAASVFGWRLYQLRSIDLGFTPTYLWTFYVAARALGKNDGEIRNEYQSITEESGEFQVYLA